MLACDLIPLLKNSGTGKAKLEWCVATINEHEKRTVENPSPRPMTADELVNAMEETKGFPEGTLAKAKKFVGLAPKVVLRPVLEPESEPSDPAKPETKPDDQKPAKK